MFGKWELLWQLMRGNRMRYAGAVVATAFSALLSLIPTLVIRTTVDSIIGDKPMDVPTWVEGVVLSLGGRDVLTHNLWVCGLALLVVSLINGALMYVRGKWTAQASESMAKGLRDLLYDHLQNLPYDEHVKAETGDWIQRCTSDVETIRRFFAVQMVEIGRTAFLLVMALAIMFSLDIRMTFISIGVIPLIFAFSYVFFTKVRDAFRLADEAEGRLTTVLQENLTGIRVVKAFGRQAYEVEKFDSKNREYRDLSYRLARLMASYWALSDFLIMAQMVVVMITGVYWAAQGIMTLGTLLTFASYEGMLLWPVRQMGRMLTDMGRAQISLTRIKELLDKPKEDMEEDGLTPDLNADIEFKNVYFEYEKGRPVLKDVSFKVKKGQTVAILGPTGAGKSSLVHLLLRLYDYQKGSITIGGVELKEINKRWLRKNIGIVLQEPFLFSRTIKENVALGRSDVTEEEILEAMRVAALTDVIQQFEEGYDTLVGERGVTLSGGQKQRVAIARALVRNSSILIFDDSLSAVDTETDAAIRKALRQRRKGITTFIISHRITTLSEADLILVLDQGRLVQSGTHEELIRQPGLYQRIWALQSRLEEELLEENGSLAYPAQERGAM
ncbi:ATP-binding cassette subfamily B protein [Caldicoprobacter guelmensis]|uniref:ABC transporter ATP-binding protein n=1 Tax=Caldicoprobacter guelmensis TaxID=1170224 RepID=UPI00195657A0|nr:ABC transporter ATP-binding protein [Caldicoprobacter guelmensis]MBM7582354.1 ATP-binding cassette subfamily B protein [Caldicoprobacter guelmensis]